MVLLAVVICALAANEDISLWAALPGLIAGVAGFAVSADSRRDGVRPMWLLPAAVLTAAALLLVPAGRTTWAPMENLAQRIRSVMEDYIRFTEERMAFSINEKGYDHAGMVDDEVVAMLGGPADPTEDVVMRVRSDSNLLLRGTIKRSYTGYSWVDDQVKARYLYYDFTHRNVRGSVFDAETAKDSDGFVTRSGSVEAAGDEMFDVVVANILAGPLRELAPGIMGRMKDGAVLVLSGILTVQADAVAEAYSALGEPKRFTSGDWTALVWA
jgi:hypothetical protein